MTRAILIAATLVVAGCYGPAVDPCHVTCASDTECPGGAVCGEGGRCHPANEPTACSAIDDDGGVPDGGLPVGAFSALAVGHDFACAIGATDREVYCWGYGGWGALGDGQYTSRGDARVIAEPGPWKAIGSGYGHVCAIKESGALFCWGAGLEGQIDGESVDPEVGIPREVELPGDPAVIAVDGGWRHTCAIDDQARMWCWGMGDEGQLGNGLEPGVQAPSIVAGHTGWTAVAANRYYTCALKDDTAFCWGLGPVGQAKTEESPTPVAVEGGVSWRQITAGQSHVCGVTAAGALMCWGANNIGEMGDTSSLTPGVAQDGDDYTVALAGLAVTCAHSTSDGLICFGTNNEGQLGRGNRAYSPQPAQVDLPRPIVAGQTGYEFTCVLDDAGTVYCWGHDDYGQCGDGRMDDQFFQAQDRVVGVTGTIAVITAMDDHTCALNTDGQLWCWGSNAVGELGVGDRVDRGTPVEIPKPDGMDWTAVSTGEAHTCAISNGRMYCWGSDADGRIGNGSPSDDVLSPVQVGGAATWTGVAAGGLHTCGLDTNSARWCWGDDTDHSLGGGATVTGDQTSPILMPSSPGPPAWRELIGGEYYGCGIGAKTNTGELWCWGDNSDGKIGLGGAVTSVDVPTRVEPPSADWLRLATDILDGATCGIRGSTSGGSLYCWGNGDNYNLGLGNNNDVTTPSQVGSGMWLQVDTGSGFTCAIDHLLGLHCWGLNSSLQAVDDQDVYHVQEVPIAPTISGMTFSLLTVGWSHVCAVRADSPTDDDEIYCWGGSTYGQRGDGNQAHLTPEPVVLGR